MVRLNIEKTLFLQWAERIGLLGEGKNNLQIYSVVANTLSCILYLLSDAEKLWTDYGVESSSSTLELARDRGIGSSQRIGYITYTYRQLQARIGIRQGDVGHYLRTRWAIHDREKSSSLIQELESFVQSLNDLLPASEHHRRLEVQCGIEMTAQDVRSLPLIQKASRTNHRNWSDAASVRAD